MSKKKAKPGLGKGLGALLPSIEYSDKGFKFKPKDEQKQGGGESTPMISLSDIKTNPYQPRKEFDAQALEDLKISILEHGVIQPITVRRAVDGYELIAGERRFRASTEAGLDKIPAYIIDVENGSTMLEIALIENVQRENLNPIEVANGYQRLIEECHLTQEQLAAKVGKDRTTVTNFLRLLRLPEKIQESLRKKEITMGHARALLACAEQKNMLLAWHEVINNALSVRATETLAKEIESGKIKPGENNKPQKKEPKAIITPEEAYVLADNENKLRHIYGTQVKIQPKTKESGSIEFEFYSKDDLERLLDLFSSLES